MNAEIATDLELEPAKISELRRIAQDPLSLETPLGEEDDSTLGDFVEDTDAEAPVTSASFKLLQEYLRMVLEEVGKHFRVTRERIRQLETKALAKLRQPLRAR